MLTRRNFFAGACCLFHAGPALAASRGRDGPKFICTASDDPPTPDDDPPTASSANPVETSPEPRTAVIEGREVRVVVEKYRMVRATLHRPERWLPEHGSTPDTDVITLNVHFMGGTAADQKRVWLVASEWLRGGLEKRIRFVFGTSRSRSQIRVTFNPKETSTSEVGALALKVPPSDRTMNLGEVSRRAILHEFGHALGLRHEQHHPNAPIEWDREAILKDLQGRGFNASEAEAYAENNVFPRFDKRRACGDFDPHSVMLYPVEKAWTRNGFSSKLNQTISRGDLSCLARTYGV
jgi:serralysin